MEHDMNNPKVERLAYWLWQQRSMPMGSPDEDWFLAEELLKDLSGHEMPWFAFSMGKRTR